MSVSEFTLSASATVGEIREELARREAAKSERRDELARILETVAKDGLPEPRDLDVACDAIEELFKD